MPTRRFAPVPRPGALTDSSLNGMWVAVIGDEVVAAAETSHKLALRLYDMDYRKRRNAVVSYVRPDSETYIVGIG